MSGLERLLTRRNALIFLSGLFYLIAWNREVNLLYGMFALVSATVSVAVILPRFALGGITASRRLPAAAFEGEEIEVCVAMLRSRLFDIDVVIRKTLIYSVLTSLLALVYFGGVVLLQQVLRGVTGGASELAIVVSTLAIAALFTPLRRLVQDFIDRRFFRRKYDAAKTLAAFGETARDETDMERLRTRLLEVVQDTMQPETVALWLKPDASAEQALGIPR